MGMQQKKPNKFWEMKMSADKKSADVFIYGEIVSYQWDDSDTTASSFKKELDNLGDVSAINLYINSPGGSVFEGVAIHNMLKRHQASVTVHVDALAASIASVIAMAGDKVVMPKNSMLMIHNPWTFAMGNASELRKVADDLDRIGGSAFQTYIQKAGNKLAEDKLQEMLDVETWLSADEAYEFGLCDIVEESNQMVASVSEEMFAKYKNVPKQIISQPDKQITAEEMAQRQRIIEESKANQAYLNTILGGII